MRIAADNEIYQTPTVSDSFNWQVNFFVGFVRFCPVPLQDHPKLQLLVAMQRPLQGPQRSRVLASAETLSVHRFWLWLHPQTQVLLLHAIWIQLIHETCRTNGKHKQVSNQVLSNSSPQYRTPRSSFLPKSAALLTLNSSPLSGFESSNKRPQWVKDNKCSMAVSSPIMPYDV